MITVLYLWRIPRLSLGTALFHMAFDRQRMKRLLTRNEISFFKLLGTGKGETFTPLDADATRWGLLVCLPENDLERFDNCKIINSWRIFARSEARIVLNPIASHGKWAGQEPFQPNPHSDWPGQVAAITRARIAPKQNVRFWRSVPPVTRSLRKSPGLSFAIGIGEAPIGLQGTFSIWDSASALRSFAYQGVEHQRVISATKQYAWYSEELFARFEVISIRGELVPTNSPSK